MPVGLSPPSALPRPARPTLTPLLTLAFNWGVVPTDVPVKGVGGVSNSFEEGGLGGLEAG